MKRSAINDRLVGLAITKSTTHVIIAIAPSNHRTRGTLARMATRNKTTRSRGVSFLPKMVQMVCMEAFVS